MVEIGKEVRRSLVMIPAQIKIREDWYYTYACKRCKEENIETPVVKTEKSAPVISGSYASAEAIAHIMVQKFDNGFSAVPTGAGMEPAGCEAVPADHVQLDIAGSGRLAEAGVRGVAQTAGTAGCAPRGRDNAAGAAGTGKIRPEQELYVAVQNRRRLRTSHCSV